MEDQFTVHRADSQHDCALAVVCQGDGTVALVVAEQYVEQPQQLAGIGLAREDLEGLNRWLTEWLAVHEPPGS